MYERTALLTFVLEPADLDLDLQCDTILPDWLVEKVAEKVALGWAVIFDPPYREETQYGLTCETTWTEWGLRRGVAPSQPFQIRIYTEEGTDEVSWEFVGLVTPPDTADTIAAWLMWFMQRRTSRFVVARRFT